MLKEITKQTALDMINESKDVQFYHTKLKRMFSWNELMDCCRFLIDDEDTISSKKLEEVHMVQIKQEKDEIMPEIKPGSVLAIAPDDKTTESTDNMKCELIRTSQNDIKTETEDIPDPDDPNASINDGKKGRKITVDLGKLYALKRAGWKNKDIASELNCSLGTVSKYINNTVLEQKVLSDQKSKM